MSQNTSTLSVRPARYPEEASDIARLCWAYRDLLIERTTMVPEIVDAYYAKDSYAALIDDLPRIHARPVGEIFIATLDGEAVGCAMHYPLNSEGLCEIKRVFVDPKGRGHGVGRALMHTCMTAAKADGHNRMVLDTMINLKEAIALYQDLGFTPADPFYELDPQFADYIRFFGIDLI
ncbi:MAG: GNAT family N-acetyltransferase [Pseudomonadota bacterium]